MKKVALFTVLASLGLSAHAQTTDATEPPPVYDVELVIFEYVSGVRGSREDWQYIDTGREQAAREQALLSPPEAMSDPTDALTDTVDTDATDPETAPEAQPIVLSFEPIAAEQRRLGEQYQRLRNSRDFRPILHTAWRQPVYPANQETTLQLSSVARNTPANLGGEISLFVSRFLHLTLDLQLAGQRTGLDSLVFKLNEQRKMRSAELHFFDHPRFGALALISKAEQPESASD
ncbi:MAG: CsiV family protein [Pseudomonadota bacterium]